MQNFGMEVDRGGRKRTNVNHSLRIWTFIKESSHREGIYKLKARTWRYLASIRLSLDKYLAVH